MGLLAQIQSSTKGRLVRLKNYIKTFQDEIESGDFFSKPISN
jgi:hypothetical protein